MAKLTMANLSRLKVYAPGKARKGEDAANAKEKKLGKVHQLVFSPDSKKVVGITIKRPDIAGMVKQNDLFVPLDSMKVREKDVFCSGDKSAYDAAACKRLNIDYDKCILWEGCDVKTESGKFIGYVMDACFDSETGVVDYYAAQEGSTASALVGNFEIPAAWVLGFKDGRMIVNNQAANLELSGGLAGKAGEGYAVAKDKAKEGVAKADEAAAKAVDKGSHALGGVIARTKAGVEGFKENYQEASGTKKPQASNQVSTASAAPNAQASVSASSSTKTSTADSTKVANSNANGDNVAKAAKAVGSQLKKSKGMFSDFMNNFKEASK